MTEGDSPDRINRLLSTISEGNVYLSSQVLERYLGGFSLMFAVPSKCFVTVCSFFVRARTKRIRDGLDLSFLFLRSPEMYGTSMG